MADTLDTLDNYADPNDTLDNYAPDIVTPEPSQPKKKKKSNFTRYIIAALVIIILCLVVLFIHRESFRNSRGPASQPPANYSMTSSPSELYVGSEYTTRMSERLSWGPVELQEIERGTRNIPGRMSIGTAESFLECEAKCNSQPSLVLGSAVWYSSDGECTARVV
jgi:hypothetical protein